MHEKTATSSAYPYSLTSWKTRALELKGSEISLRRFISQTKSAAVLKHFGLAITLHEKISIRSDCLALVIGF